MKLLTPDRDRLLPAMLLALLVAACAPPPAQAPAAAPAAAAAAQTEQGAFVTTLGRDTIAVERYTLSGNRFEGRQVLRIPRTVVRDYVATLAPDGSISRFEMHVRSPDEAQPTQHFTMDFGPDTVTVEAMRPEGTQTFRVPGRPGAIPSVGGAYALYTLPIRQLRAAGQDSLTIALIPTAGAQPGTIQLRREGPQEVRVTNIAGENRVRVDQAGRLLTYDGRGSTFQVVAERVPTLDVDALAADYAARDREGRGFGALSPRDSLEVTVGGANVSVNYGRPLRRGRTIFGEVVPWNEVWRTGANQATRFSTDRELQMGGVTVPAGSYSLFTIPSPTGWTLILNRQTEQWGTVHDPAQDQARIEMQRETLPERMEQFTIGIEPRGQGGVLWMAWDDTRASVPFTVR